MLSINLIGVYSLNYTSKEPSPTAFVGRGIGNDINTIYFPTTLPLGPNAKFYLQMGGYPPSHYSVMMFPAF